MKPMFLAVLAGLGWLSLPQHGDIVSGALNPDRLPAAVSAEVGRPNFQPSDVAYAGPAEKTPAVSAKKANAQRAEEPATNADETEGYAQDAFRLFGLLESWPGQDRAETSRLLAEAFVEPLRGQFSPEERRQLAQEFEPKIVGAFQDLAAAACREHFTRHELRELIRFFESSLGRKYARAYPDLINRMRAGDAQRAAVVNELQRRIRPRATLPENRRP